MGQKNVPNPVETFSPHMSVDPLDFKVVKKLN